MTINNKLKHLLLNRWREMEFMCKSSRRGKCGFKLSKHR